MDRDMIWVPWSGPGLEHLRLAQRDDEIVADGLIIGVSDGAPFRARYVIRCDARWRVREIRVDLSSDSGREIALRADGAGFWTTASGEPVPSLDGCIDVDISATPFTNTLAIRRLGLEPGETSDLTVAYVAIPEMRVWPEKQRYTCLAAHAQGGLYRFESLDGDFTAELPVDSDGLVSDYPELFRKVFPQYE
jgi:hypothetical protein